MKFTPLQRYQFAHEVLPLQLERESWGSDFIANLYGTKASYRGWDNAETVKNALLNFPFPADQQRLDATKTAINNDEKSTLEKFKDGITQGVFGSSVTEQVSNFVGFNFRDVAIIVLAIILIGLGILAIIWANGGKEVIAESAKAAAKVA